MGESSEIAAAFSLDGRVTVVTGAASGLGRATARIFALAGARLVLADVDEAGLDETAALVGEAGGSALIHKTDVAVRDQVEALADAALDRCGRLDVWVNSAGVTLWKSVIEASREEAERVVAINMMGTYWGCAAAGRAMQARGGGAIVNVSSTAGESPVPTLSVYGMTKAAVNQLTRVCAKEFGTFGTRVNAVVPGWIDTPINTSMYRTPSGEVDLAMREVVVGRMAGMSPLGLTGDPSDIALAILYLASDASRFVTGETLRVSGGVSKTSITIAGECTMDVVDSQVHMGPGGAAEMVAAMDALGIKSALIDEWWLGTPGHPFYPVGDGALRTASPTAELASWTYPGRFSYLVRVDYRDPELRNVARFARDATYARALRVSPAMSRAELAALSSGQFDGVFAAACEFGLPVFVMIAGKADLLVPYLKKFPDLKVILCHCGTPPGARMRGAIIHMEDLPDSKAYWDKVGEEPVAEGFDKVLRMADWPNVALKWAHAPMMFDQPGYPNAGTRPFLRKAIDAFGADRVMWASDISANMTGESWAELLFAIRTNPDLSTEEREAVLGKTARAWIGWEADS